MLARLCRPNNFDFCCLHWTLLGRSWWTRSTKKSSREIHHPMSRGRRNGELIWFHSSTWAKPSQALLWCAHSVGKGVAFRQQKTHPGSDSFHKLFGIEIFHVLVHPAAISGHIVHCPGRYGPFSGDMSLFWGEWLHEEKGKPKKMPKSAAGWVWLNKNKNPPQDFNFAYNYWLCY